MSQFQFSEKLFEKVITNGRGGWCHELNALFEWLLRNLGFKTTIVESNFFSHQSHTWDIDFDHMLIIVTFDSGEQWIADVGLGLFKQHILPLKIEQGLVQEQPTGFYK